MLGFLPFVADGASAEYVLAAADSLAPAPTSIPLAEAAALPVVGLTAWQALHEHAGLQPGQRILINGADGAVGGYAIQLAKAVGAQVIATASARTSAEVAAAGADQVIDHTAASVVDEVAEPVDVLLNLAPIEPGEFATLAGLVRDGGVVVNTTVWMPAPADEDRGVRGIDLYVRSDAAQLAGLAELVDRGQLKVQVAQRAPLEDLASIHAQAAAGTLHGKVVITPEAR